MKHLLFVLTLLLGLLVALALAACSSTRTPSPTLAGHWAPLSAELGGQVFPVANFGGATLRLTMDTYEFADDKGTYAVLSTSPPAKMDIRGQEGPTHDARSRRSVNSQASNSPSAISLVRENVRVNSSARRARRFCLSATSEFNERGVYLQLRSGANQSLLDRQHRGPDRSFDSLRSLRTSG